MFSIDFLNDPIDVGTFFLLIVLHFLGSRLVDGSAKLLLIGKRIAVASFFLFVVVQANHWKTSTTDEWAAILFRSLLFSGIVLGAAYTILPVLVFVYDHTLGKLFRTFDEWSKDAQKRAEKRSADREQEQRNAKWERDRPRREREAHEAALRAEADARVKRSAQKRKEDARAECDALYALAAPEIGDRFSKQEYSEFVSKYMTDAYSPEVVEERGDQLKGIIHHHWKRIEPPRQGFKELSEWFERQMKELESVPDERLRKSLIVQLKGRYSELTTEMLSEMSP